MMFYIVKRNKKKQDFRSQNLSRFAFSGGRSFLTKIQTNFPDNFYMVFFYIMHFTKYWYEIYKVL